MILKASQRGGDAALAAHLLNIKDNDHVEVHAINGFMANDVAGAFQEIRAVSQATNCKQYMFSLSLSPPEEEIVNNDAFMEAIDQSMKRLGLAGQPHVILFHEKHGRRHAHLVVSRIDSVTMKAINLSFFKDRLCDLSRELYLAHGWELPQGHIDRKLSDPLNYSLEEYQVAKRVKRDPKELKSTLIDCWAQSDSKAGFEAALNDAGFRLCQGDRRGFVAIDKDGKVYSLSRWLGVKTKELKARLGNLEHLPSIEEALAQFTSEETHGKAKSEFTSAADPLVAMLDKQIVGLEDSKAALIQSHRQARIDLRKQQHKQRIEEIHHFKQSGSPLRRLWQWAVGNRNRILAERQEQLNVLNSAHEAQALELSQLQRVELRTLRAEITELKRQRDAIVPLPKPKQDLSQFIKKADPDFLFHKSHITKSPDYVLRLLSDKHESFSRNDITRKLAEYISNPAKLNHAIEQVLQSSELITLDNQAEETNSNPCFTTKAYQRQHRQLLQTASFLTVNKAYGVSKEHLNAAIHKHNQQLQKQVGATLSKEQCQAIEHILNRRQLSNVVGLAGAGKSTMLSAAKEAWESQGYNVMGGALSGKAADGLQQASSIPSRTLHSWEHGWKHGRNHLKAGDVFVIDEAGMVGTAQLNRILKHVHEQKAKLVLVGDPDQLQPIQAGTPFRDITKQSGYAELTEIHRQKSDWQKAASLELARGDTDKAIQTYEAHGMVEHAQSEHDAIAALVEDYMVDYELHGDSKSRLALAHRRQDVFAINKAIRAARKSAHELQDEQVFETDHGKRAFAVGDRILFTRNDYDLNVKNGMLGLVTQVDDSRIVVQMDEKYSKDSNNIILNTKRFSSFDHGYATTIHKAQGATIDYSFVLKSNSMDENLSYVAMTRHRDMLRVYADHKKTKLNSSSVFSHELKLEL